VYLTWPCGAISPLLLLLLELLLLPLQVLLDFELFLPVGVPDEFGLPAATLLLGVKFVPCLRVDL
jgi:hypothetical protein